ncbi:MAG: O-antigen ligase family protein [Sarcina sp.]
MTLKQLLKIDINNKTIIRSIIFLTVFLMPFLVSKTNKPHYLMAKVYYMYIAGFLLLILLIKDNFQIIKFNIMNFKFNSLFKLKTYKNFFKNNFELKILIIFLFSYTACTIFSKYFGTALLGNSHRYEGLLIYYIYGLLLFASFKYISLNSKIIEFSCICASLMGLITIFQLYNIDPIYKYFLGTPGTLSEFGTIGNRNFLSTYLLLFQPIAVYGFIILKKNRYLFYNIIIFGAILSAQTRSVWLAFLIISIIFILSIIKKKASKKRLLVLILCFICVLFTINSSTKNTIVLRSQTIATELNTAKTSGKTDSLGSGRGAIWSETLKSIAKNPFIGFGPDTLDKRFNYYFPDINFSNADKAHNEYLEYWATGGILTLISYLLLTLSILIKLFKKNDNISNCLFLIVLGYMLQAFFNISVIQVAPIYWIILGISLKYISYSSTIQNF